MIDMNTKTLAGFNLRVITPHCTEEFLYEYRLHKPSASKIDLQNKYTNGGI